MATIGWSIDYGSKHINKIQDLFSSTTTIYTNPKYFLIVLDEFIKSYKDEYINEHINVHIYNFCVKDLLQLNTTKMILSSNNGTHGAWINIHEIY